MWGTFKSISILVVSVTLLAVLLAGVLWADSSAHLYIPGIHGSTGDAAHRNWIKVLWCDWDSIPPPRGSMVTAGEKGPAGKLCFGDFSFLKYVDASSEVLADYCSRNLLIPHIRIELPHGTSAKFKYLLLRKVKILSVQQGKKEKDGNQTEVIKVSFSQVEYQ